MAKRTILKTWLVISIFLVVLGGPATVAGKTIYVDDDGPADFNNIQAAIDDANDGDTVIVAPGTYTGEGNRDIDFKGKAITVKSEDGPESCIIVCNSSHSSTGRPRPDSHRGFNFHSNEDINSVVCGFTVTGGGNRNRKDEGGAFYCDESSPTIRDCIIVRNAAESGGGIWARNSHMYVSNCIITENSAQHSGGIRIISGETCFVDCIISGNVTVYYGYGVYCEGGNHQFTNCTVTGNRLRGERGGGGIRFSVGREDAVCNLTNCIVWGNRAGSLGDEIRVPQAVMHHTAFTRLRIEYCLIGEDASDVPDWLGMISGNWLMTDPSFARNGYWDPNGTSEDFWDDFWVEGDYHLKSQAGRWDPNSQSWIQDDVTSPCIDASDPNSPIGHEPFPNGGIVNMGAYGGTPEASKSHFGGPVCETIIAGDINGDCKVDFEDFKLMVSHWLECTAPDCDLDQQPPPGGGPSMPNPAAVYCVKLGYKLEVVTDEEGNQYGVCIFPDGSECGSWDFYRGKCGQEWSYCNLHGYDLKELGRYEGWFKGAICIDKTTGKEIGTVFDLFIGEFLSWSLPYPVGDLNQDCRVNLLDFAIMALHWLAEGELEN